MKDNLKTLKRIENLKNNPSSSGNDSLLETKVTISSAQILDAENTPIVIVPAPGVDKFIQVVSGVIRYTFGTIAYGAGFSQFGLFYEDDPSNSSLAAIGDLLITEEDSPSTFGPGGYVGINKALIASALGAFVDGDGTLDIYITYQIKTV